MFNRNTSFRYNANENQPFSNCQPIVLAHSLRELQIIIFFFCKIDWLGPHKGFRLKEPRRGYPRRGPLEGVFVKKNSGHFKGQFLRIMAKDVGGITSDYCLSLHGVDYFFWILFFGLWRHFELVVFPKCVHAAVSKAEPTKKMFKNGQKSR